MDSQSENNFTISSLETLLPHHDHQPPKQTKNKNLKGIIFITILILIILTATSTTLISMSKPKKPKPIDLYVSNSNRYYCHLAYHPELCYNSMTSAINTTKIQTNPNAIFSTAIQVAINQINNITFPESTDSLRLSKCRTWMRDSLSRLNESVCMIVDSGIASLTYEEMDNMRAGIVSAVSNARECVLALEEMGVEEAKMGVEKAMACMVNSVGLLNGREAILHDFYNPVIEFDDDYYYYDLIYHNQFDYRFLICLYSGMYLFLWFLYFLFWWGN